MKKKKKKKKKDILEVRRTEMRTESNCSIPSLQHNIHKSPRVPSHSLLLVPNARCYVTLVPPQKFPFSSPLLPCSCVRRHLLTIHCMKAAEIDAYPSSESCKEHRLGWPRSSVSFVFCSVCCQRIPRQADRQDPLPACDDSCVLKLKAHHNITDPRWKTRSQSQT